MRYHATVTACQQGVMKLSKPQPLFLRTLENLVLRGHREETSAQRPFNGGYPMEEDIVAIIVIGGIIFTPVFGLTVRIALKPFVDSIARVMEARARGAAADSIDRRLALMEQELERLRQENQRLYDQRDFYRQLERPRV